MDNARKVFMLICCLFVLLSWFGKHLLNPTPRVGSSGWIEQREKETRRQSDLDDLRRNLERTRRQSDTDDLMRNLERAR
jgi:hypothetical protein